VTDEATGDDLPTTWSGYFRAAYPDGYETDFNASRAAISPGFNTGDGHVLDHWKRAEHPKPDGSRLLLGFSVTPTSGLTASS
jgi:hypothetical protein